ncbi:MAG TPA: glycosyl hydrolase family 18 protein [Terriglobia bacterium]|nr:glycosyl hydrolase family 18 protein [Terriglobia bacterium]
MAGEDRGNGCFQFRRANVYLLLAVCVALSPGCEKKAPSGPTIAVPTFIRSFAAAGHEYHYTVVGKDPAQGGTLTIPTVVVPVSLVFDAPAGKAGKKVEISAADDVQKVAQSPIFQKYAFATGDTQYGDAVQRAQFYNEASAKDWHTMLGQPRVTSSLRITIPPANGYLLTSKKTGNLLAIVDLDFVQKELFNDLAKMQARPDELVIALTKNTEFYELNDATVCCTWGAHGAQSDASSKALQPFVLSTYLDPGVVPDYDDIQPLTQQLAAWMNDPLHGQQENTFPAWQKPVAKGGCGGQGIGTHYRFALPTDGVSESNATVVKTEAGEYHLENVALLPWYAQNAHPDSYQGAYSFPDTGVLKAAAEPCAPRGQRLEATPTASPAPNPHAPNGHQLIGYWVGYSRSKTIPLRDVSPQWDIIIVAFAAPVKGSTSTLQFETPAGYTKEQFRDEIAAMKRKGKKILISLGGGGQVVKLDRAEDLKNFVESVGAVVADYGFDGVDLDLETPSLILDAGDTDFRKPTTPCVVNLIEAMRQLRNRFGPKFMLAEVPEGPQVPAGYVAYAGQFGSFLPVIYATRNMLSFVDVQDYNTPPLEGMDGNYYMPETADYYVAMTEMLVHGFHVGRNSRSYFPPLAPEKVAVGFLVGRSKLSEIEKSVKYLITGKPFGGEYSLQRNGGYRNFNGVMFWNIQADRGDNYQMSNALGPLLHSLPRR